MQILALFLLLCVTLLPPLAWPQALGAGNITVTPPRLDIEDASCGDVDPATTPICTQGNDTYLRQGGTYTQPGTGGATQGLDDVVQQDRNATSAVSAGTAACFGETNPVCLYGSSGGGAVVSTPSAPLISVPDGQAWGVERSNGGQDILRARGTEGNVELGGTTCLAVSSDRIYHDTDCDGTKDAGEELIDFLPKITDTWQCTRPVDTSAWMVAHGTCGGAETGGSSQARMTTFASTATVLCCRVSAAPGNDTVWTWTLRINETTNTALTVSIATSATSACDTAHTHSFAQGDIKTLSWSETGTTGGTPIATCGVGSTVP